MELRAALKHVLAKFLVNMHVFDPQDTIVQVIQAYQAKREGIFFQVYLGSR